jgi:hypothetical protein
MLFGMILKYLGPIHDRIKAIVVESRGFLSIAMIGFLGDTEWSMLVGGFDAGKMGGAA